MLPKDKGGLGLINVDIKSKCILANTFIKAFVNPEQISFMMEYYNNIRIWQLFNKPLYINNVSFTGTTYQSKQRKQCVYCNIPQKIGSVGRKIFFSYFFFIIIFLAQKTFFQLIIELKLKMIEPSSLWQNKAQNFHLKQ